MVSTVILIGMVTNPVLHSRDSSQVPLWLCSAIWANPTRVTTVTVPIHIGTRKGVNTSRPAGTMQILTTRLAGTRSHVHTLQQIISQGQNDLCWELSLKIETSTLQSYNEHIN